MALKYYFLLISIHLAYTDIAFDINGIQDRFTINHWGKDHRLIEDEDARLFKIGDEALKATIEEMFGRRPDEVYLRQPTPWGNYYERQRWEQTMRTIVVKSARVVDSNESEGPTVLATKTLKNFSNRPMKVDTSLNQEVLNLLNITWDKKNLYTAPEKFNYNINLSIQKGSKITAFPFTAKWSEDEEIFKTVTVGSTVLSNSVLPARHEVTSVLSVNEGHVEIEVEYEISLRGNVLAYFKDPYKDRSFWGPNLTDVMIHGNMPMKIMQKETLKGFYYINDDVNVSTKPLA